MSRKSPYAVVLTDEEQRVLQEIAAKYTSPYCQVVRAKVVLLAAEGLLNSRIAQRLDLPRHLDSMGGKRLSHARRAGRAARPRRGRPGFFPPGDCR